MPLIGPPCLSLVSVKSAWKCAIKVPRPISPTPTKTAMLAGALTTFNVARESRPNVSDSKPIPTSAGRGHATIAQAIVIPPATAAIISQRKRHLSSGIWWMKRVNAG